MEFKLENNNSEDIDFATACLISGVLSFDEFKQWLYFIIENTDDYPTYIFDILEVKEKFDYTLRSREVIGFMPSWQGASDDEDNALDGIAYKRIKDHVSDAVSRKTALKALEKNPHIEKRFREMFPFIEW